MELKGSKTEQSLRAAFAAESQARNRYLLYVAEARRLGFSDIADVFAEIAQNEAEHARHELEFLDELGDIRGSVEAAIQGERREHEAFYPGLAETARAEGFAEIATFFDAMSRVEGTHAELLRTLLQSLDEGTTLRSRTVGHSAVTMAQVMLPEQANPAGFVHGGELMKIMDNAAGVVATRHASANVVTARVQDVSFLRPVRVGSLVLVKASLAFVSRSSMEVRVEVEAEHLGSGLREPALTAHFVMVALDATGRPVEVPALVVTTEHQARLFDEGRARYEARLRAGTEGV